jgi:hypothetical protein
VVQEKSPPVRQVSPEKQLRAAMLKGRFADLIVKSQEKSLPDNKVVFALAGCHVAMQVTNHCSFCFVDIVSDVFRLMRNCTLCWPSVLCLVFRLRFFRARFLSIESSTCRGTLYEFY